jgi:hypothetical protein
MNIDIEQYSDWKSTVDSANLDHQYYMKKGRYVLLALNGTIIYEHNLDASNDVDYETNYKSAANKKNINQQSPFATKILPDGKKLFAREHGIPQVTIAAGATASLVLEVPYISCKITDAEIIGCKEGDTVNFKILDTDSGTLSTIPLYPLNQFGTNVNMSNGIYVKKYAYDADLFIGLHIDIEYTNNGLSPVTVSANIGLHEVKV